MRCFFFLQGGFDHPAYFHALGWVWAKGRPAILFQGPYVRVFLQNGLVNDVFKHGFQPQLFLPAMALNKSRILACAFSNTSLTFSSSARMVQTEPAKRRDPS